MLFGTPAMPCSTFSMTNGERLGTDFSSLDVMTNKCGEVEGADEDVVG